MGKPQKIHFLHSIKTELTFWFLLIALLPLIFVGLLSYNYATEGLIESAKLQLIQSSNLNVRFIENWFEYRFMDIKSQAKDKHNIALLKNFSGEFNNSQLPVDKFVKSNRWQNTRTNNHNELELIIKDYDYIYDLFLIDKVGNILYTVLGESDLGTNINDNLYSSSKFAKSVNISLVQEKTNLSGFERYSPSHNAISSFITTPIFDSTTGNILGVLAMQIRLNRVFELLEPVEGKEIHHFIVNEQGNLQTPINGNFNQVLSKNLKTKQIEIIKSEHGEHSSSISKAIEKAMIYPDDTNTSVIGIHQPMHVDGVYWYLISEVKEAIALSSTIKLTRVILGLLIFFVALVTILSFFIARRITRPISELTHAAESVSSGELSVQIKQGYQNEIGRLAKVFNRMVLRRRLYEHNLHQSHSDIKEVLAELADQQHAINQHSIVAITDVKGTITYVNDKFCEISGYSREELIGNNHRLIRSAEHNDEFFNHLYHTVSKGHVWKNEVCNKAKDGHLYWLDTTIVPFMGENNRPKSYIAIRTDITERVLITQKQHKTEKSLKAAQKIAHLGSWELDLNSRHLFWSDEVFEIFELDVKTVTPNYELFLSAIHPDDRANVQERYESSIKNKQAYNVEHRLQMADGRIKYVNERCETSYDDNAQPIKSFGTILDITDRIKSEKALQGAQKMEAIGQLSGGIAHDFNNILGVIIGNLDLLTVQLSDDSKAIKRLQSASKAANRAANLTKQLLDFSRRRVAESEQVNINHLVMNMNELLRHSVGHKIKMNYNFSDELGIVDIDPGDFHDALLNLVINAKDAIEHSGEIIIESANCSLDEAFCHLNVGAVPGEYIKLAISDNGSGIDEDIQHHIFEPFFTTKIQGKGTGLGLSMVFGFVKRSKGYIQVYSELNIGTTFKIYLPRVKASTEKDVANVSYKPVIEQSVNLKDLKGSETILIVDDETGLVDLAQQTLTELGYHVVTANDAKQALTLFSNTDNIALLFSDIVMPGKINGFELAEQAKQAFPHISVLLTSGYTEKAAQNYGIVDQHFELLAKPYAQIEMASKIRQILDDSRAENNHEIGELSEDKSQLPPIIWSDDFNTGIKAIDADHQQLLVLLNQCQQIIINKRHQELGDILERLLTYTNDHFSREETVMLTCDYPHYKSHKQVHRLLIKQIKYSISLLSQGRLTEEELLEFLSSWLIDHIAGLDNEIAFYCKNKEQEVEKAIIEFNQQLKQGSPDATG